MSFLLLTLLSLVQATPLIINNQTNVYFITNLTSPNVITEVQIQPPVDRVVDVTIVNQRLRHEDVNSMLQSLTNLKYLMLDTDVLNSTLYIEPVTSLFLTVFSLSDNRLTKIELDDFFAPQLTHLDLSLNFLTIIPNISHFYNIKTVDLRQNHIMRLEVNTFIGNTPFLRFLFLTENAFTYDAFDTNVTVLQNNNIRWYSRAETSTCVDDEKYKTLKYLNITCTYPTEADQQLDYLEKQLNYEKCLEMQNEILSNIDDLTSFLQRYINLRTKLQQLFVLGECDSVLESAIVYYMILISNEIEIYQRDLLLLLNESPECNDSIPPI